MKGATVAPENTPWAKLLKYYKLLQEFGQASSTANRRKALVEHRSTGPKGQSAIAGVPQAR